MSIYKNPKSIEFTSPLPDLTKFQTSKNMKILEIGCGYGRILKHLSNLCFNDLTGIDISPELIARAKVETSKNIHYICESPLEFEFTYTFDLVIMCGVLEYFNEGNDRNNLASKIHSILNKGGYLYLESFVVDYKSNGLQYLKNFFSLGDLHFLSLNSGKKIKHLRPREIDILFESNNLTKIYSKKSLFRTWNDDMANGYTGIYLKSTLE